jgi:hypothetical protein
MDDWCMASLIFRPDSTQLHGLRKGALICASLGVVAVALSIFVSGRFWPLILGFSLGTLLFAVVHWLKRGDFVEFTDAGIRNRTFGQRSECTWADVANINVRTVTRSGVTTSVVMVTRQGPGKVEVTAGRVG